MRVINNTLPSVPLTSPITDNSYVREMEDTQGNPDIPGLQERVNEEFPDVDTPPQLSSGETSLNNNTTIYSTGTPADTTSVQPKLVPKEIAFSPRLCIQTPKYIGKVDPDIKPVQFRIQQSSIDNSGQLFFSDQLDPTSTNSVTPTTPLDSTSSINAMPDQENYANLVGIETRRTDSELKKLMNRNTLT